MGRKVRLSDDLIKHYLINGLPYAFTRAVLAQDTSDTLPLFLSALIRVERATKDNMKRHTDSNGRSGPEKTTNKRLSEFMQRMDSTPCKNTSRNYTPTKTVPHTKSVAVTPVSHKRQCFICRSEDHLARRCPQRKDFHHTVVPSHATI